MKEMLLELSKNSPESLSSRSRAGEFVGRRERGKAELTKLEKEKLVKIIQALRHPELESLLDEGKLALGIIKPNVNESSLLPNNDDEASKVLLKEIGEDRIIFQISIKLNREEAEIFYTPIRPKYESRIDEKTGGTVWDSILDFTTSGPLTFILIYVEEGGAISWWRNKMGNTYPINADKNSIRGKYATMEMLPNNLTHGSDSEAEVKRELRILSQVLEKMA